MLVNRSERLLNILFLGSDHFSIGTLQAVLNATRLWESIHVVTAGEKDVGRGKNGKRKVAHQGIKDWQPPEEYALPSPTNILVTSSFGHILPSALLLSHFPALQTRLNVHPSILPQYRGAAPIQWAIANRDATTGVSVQSLATGGGKMVDRGDLWGVVEGVSIDSRDTYTTLLPRLATIGGDLLVKILREIQAGTATSTAQIAPHSTATTSPAALGTTTHLIPPKLRRAPKITHETVHVDFARQTAEEVEALFRGMSHQHALWTTLPDGQELRLLDIRIPASSTDLPPWSSVEPGTTVFQKLFTADPVEDVWASGSKSQVSGSGSGVRAGSGGRLLIRTRSGEEEVGAGWIEIRRVQQAGKKELSVWDWWNGLKLGKGRAGKLVLGSSSQAE
ncbi:hypothetical protein QFC24_006892 [Naganishia onofrii]|uniref:Uncharacterized protein n=1 Tax=Naganishia onofrii TaxID=1851511 RepID=A0ACC2WXC6_9TREE|nr:hypothetical protein QFC24_006892 [Naganishia onofrii]